MLELFIIRIRSAWKMLQKNSWKKVGKVIIKPFEADFCVIL